MKESPRERARRLRRLGIRGAIAAFVVAWALVFGQLALGHDPVLSKSKSTQKHKSSSSSSSTSSAPEPSAQSPEPQSQTPAPVTTSQS